MEEPTCPQVFKSSFFRAFRARRGCRRERVLAIVVKAYAIMPPQRRYVVGPSAVAPPSGENAAGGGAAFRGHA